MDVKAILLLDPGAQFAGEPLATLDVLGSPVLDRLADDLTRAGVSEITVLTEAGTRLHENKQFTMVAAENKSVWQAAVEQFDETTAKKPEMVLVARVNGYMHINWQNLLAGDPQQRNRIVRAFDGDQPLDVFAFAPTRRADFEYLSRNRFARLRSEATHYRLGEDELFFPLETGADLRKLTVAALHLEVPLAPIGKQIKPGIWAAESARINKNARLVAPAYIGKWARVRAGAVVTRASAIEQRCEIDCGTVIEDANVLPYSRVGAGLDVAHSVVGSRRILHLKKHAETEVFDPLLLDRLPESVGIRTLATAGSLLSFLPIATWKGLFGNKPLATAPALSVACSQDFGSAPLYTQPEEKAGISKFAPSLAIVRKYGSQ